MDAERYSRSLEPTSEAELENLFGTIVDSPSPSLVNFVPPPQNNDDNENNESNLFDLVTLPPFLPQPHQEQTINLPHFNENAFVGEELALEHSLQANRTAQSSHALPSLHYSSDYDYGEPLILDDIRHIEHLFPYPNSGPEVPRGVVDLTNSSPRGPIQAPNRKRRAGSPAVEMTPLSKTARPCSPHSMRPIPQKESSMEIVDLREVDDETQYKALEVTAAVTSAKAADLIKAQNQADASKPTKLADFQCIICMDNPTDLTVTHCGHLFCSECLHQALYAGDKKCCPVCRTSITLAKAGGKKGRNGIFALEMKLLTANKKGKQPARAR